MKKNQNISILSKIMTSLIFIWNIQNLIKIIGTALKITKSGTY